MSDRLTTNPPGIDALGAAIRRQVARQRACNHAVHDTYVLTMEEAAPGFPGRRCKGCDGLLEVFGLPKAQPRPTRKDLLARARVLGIAGRDRMNLRTLIRKVRDAEGARA